MKTHIWRVTLVEGGAVIVTAKPMTRAEFGAHIPAMFLTGIVAYRPNNETEWTTI